MTETQLIFILFGLTLLRVAAHFKPDLLPFNSRVTRMRFKEGVDSIVWAGVVALLLIHFVVRSFYIPSGSMIPTLQVNDFILVNEFLYRIAEPARGEIVVFRSPEKGRAADKTDLIKRVVAVEGDEVEVKDGVLYINDLPQDEPYIKEPIDSDFPKTRVDQGHVFCMGDNRNDSRDSRFIGPIPLENLVGRAEVIFFPPNRIGLIR